MDGQKRDDGLLMFCSTVVYFPAKLMAMQFQSAGKSTAWSYQNTPDLSRRIVKKKLVHTKFVHLLLIRAVSVQNGSNLDDNSLKHVTV